MKLLAISIPLLILAGLAGLKSTQAGPNGGVGRRTVIWEPRPVRATTEATQYSKAVAEARAACLKAMLEDAKTAPLLEIAKLEKSATAPKTPVPMVWECPFDGQGYDIHQSIKLVSPEMVKQFAELQGKTSPINLWETRKITAFTPAYVLSFDDASNSRMVVLVSDDYRYHAVRFPDGWHAYYHHAAEDFGKLVEQVYRK